MTKRIERSIGRAQGAECPECGSMFTPVRNTGHDEDGHLIRVRVCRNCDLSFGTVEVVLPSDFSFGKTNTYKEKARKGRVAYVSNDRLIIGSVRVSPGKRTDWCAKGLHLLRGKNLLYDFRNHRLCRSCKNNRRNQHRFEHRDEINQKNREKYHKRKEFLNGSISRTASA